MISMLGKRRGTPMWADDTVQRRGGLCRRIGQEVESPLEGSLTEVGADRGDGNNRLVIISDRD